jgi:hypothetical protein
MFLASLVLPLVDGPVCPGFLALAMLQVVLPLALITRPVHVNVGTESVRLVIDPIAFVDISVNVDEFPMPVSAVVTPLPLVASTIRPHLDPVAIAEAPDPLPLICGAGLERIDWALLPLPLRIVLLIRHCLPRLIQSEVFRISLEIMMSVTIILTLLVCLRKLNNFLAE